MKTTGASFMRGTKTVRARGVCDDCPREWATLDVTVTAERTKYLNKVRNHATKTGHTATMLTYTTWAGVEPATTGTTDTPGTTCQCGIPLGECINTPCDMGD